MSFISIVIRVLLRAVVIGLILVNAGCTAPSSSPAATIAKPTEMTSGPSLPQREPERPPTTTPVVGLANPAASYCNEQGGRLEIQTTSNGGQISVCLFDDLSLCEEWAFFRGECQPGEQYTLPEGAAEPTTIDPKLAELFALVRENLPANAFDSFAAQPLTADGERQLWVVYSTGMRNFDLDPSVPHFIAVYEYTVGGWQQLDRQSLKSGEGTETLEPDFIGVVRQVNIAPERIWLQIEGGLGAHSGSYHLFSFADNTLRQELVAFSSSPGFGTIADLDGDGVAEVVLDRSERYVFCYACGVYYPFYQVYSWEKSQMVERTISELVPEYQTAPFADQNRQAVAFTHADLWIDALAAINTAVNTAGNSDPPTTGGSLRWNRRLIQKIHDAHLRAIDESAFPLINYVFFGDYDGAVAQMRSYTPADIFNVESPLIVGTVAQGWETTLGEYLVSESERALAVVPKRAAIYFIRAWGRFLKDPTDPEIETDLTRAAQLQPDTPLFVESVSWWKQR